jgi:hypothetical protein
MTKPATDIQAEAIPSDGTAASHYWIERMGEFPHSFAACCPATSVPLTFFAIPFVIPPNKPNRQQLHIFLRISKLQKP